MKNYILIFSLLGIILLGSCSTEKDYLVTIKTEYGDMHAILYDETPLHKENFIKLAKDGRFDSTTFYRIVQNFMIQGGDIDTKEGNTPSKETIPAEFVKSKFHKKGALAAARQDERVNPTKASSWSQFYIVQGKKFSEEELTTDMEMMQKKVGAFLQKEANQEILSELQSLYQAKNFDEYQKKILSLRPDIEQEFGISLSKEVAPERIAAYTTIGGAPHLDDTYTVFGELLDGLEIVDKIAAQKTRGDRAISPAAMTVSVEEIPRSKITKQYGYEYNQ